MPPAVIDSLVETLRDSGLLDETQASELKGSRPAAPADVVAELVRRGWLTPFQAAAVAAGQTRDLVLGPYVLLDRLGEGGMGIVYKARHTVMNRVVALKVVRGECLPGPEWAARFRREVEAVARLSHPNIVTAHDAARTGDGHFYVMEYLAGTDLARLVKHLGRLPVGLAGECARQAALGLQHAHEQGLVHRDIKPANLMLVAGPGGGPLVKVLDLGLARHRGPGGESGELTRDGVVMGTPDYLAPEQVDDAHAADVRADVYSLGCTLYHLLAGRPPFPGGNLMAKLTRHREIDPAPLDVVRPDVPAGLAAVVRRMTAKRPEDRYQTPAEVAAALAPFADPAAIVPAVGPAAPPGAAPSTVDRSRAESAADVPPAGLPPVADDSAFAGLVDPAPAVGSAGGRGRIPTRLLVAGAAFVAAVLVLGGVLFYHRTDQTTVLVSVDDVDLTDRALTFFVDDEPKSAAELGKPVELTVGRHEFVVKRGDEVVRRVVFRASRDAGTRFEVIEDTGPPKRKDPAAVPTPVGTGGGVAEAHPPKRQETAAAVPATDPDRAVAAWVLSKGGVVKVAALNRVPVTLDGIRAIPLVTSAAALPPGPFRLVHAGLPAGGCTDDDLARFEGVRLRSLNLTGCPVSDAGLRRVADQTELRSLILSGTRTTDDGLRHLTGLARLEQLHGSDLMTGRGFGQLRRLPLRQVILRGKPTADGFAELALLPDLRDLAASGPGVTDAAVRHLARTGLTKLDLRAPALTDAGLAHLARIGTLQMLELMDTRRVTDAGLGHLAGLTRLIWLYVLPSDHITGDGVARLRPLTNLQVLHLHSPKLGDDAVGHLTGFKNLHQLSLGSNLTGASLHHLKDLPSLRRLYLGSNRIADDGFAAMPALTKLQLLWVTDNNPGITDKSIPRLKTLTGLKTLRGGNYSPAGRKELKAALPACNVPMRGEPDPADDPDW